MPNFGRQGIDPPKRDLSNPLPELYPQGDLPQGWGLTFFLHQHPGPTGRSGTTGWWAGLPNLFWWCDREKGLGGMIASQIVPFGDATVMVSRLSYLHYKHVLTYCSGALGQRRSRVVSGSATMIGCSYHAREVDLVARLNLLPAA